MRNALPLQAATVLVLACASLVACTKDGGAPTEPDTPGALTAAQKPNGQFNEKFTFDPVTFPDNTTGVIYAASKRNKNEYTNCTYFSDDGEFLGQFLSNGFASDDADAVLNFCLTNFVNRS